MPEPRPTLSDDFARVRAATEALAAPLSPEDCLLQAMPDVSPPKWHLAHTAWFFENFLLTPFAPGYQPFHPSFSYLFNSYYETVGTFHPRPQRGLLSRPALDEVIAYRRAVTEAMLTLLRDASSEVAQLTRLGLAHEEQHQELLLMDTKYNLSVNPLRPAYTESRVWDPAPLGALEWSSFARGNYEIGHAGEGFAFDNEGPRHTVFVDDFRLASRPVTNGEYLAFIDDGGYTRPELWLSDGWAAVKRNGWESPLYWERDGAKWRVFTLSGMRDLAPNEPVAHVSLYEADAFARWSGKRLPTEAEWEIAGTRAHDVWEWTGSAYLSYPGYRPPSGAIGEYNGKFMCNQLVLRGGSRLTPPGHTRPTYRNFFPPETRWHMSGFRLAQEMK